MIRGHLNALGNSTTLTDVTDVEDLGEPSAICDMCEAHEIRYVHHMEHPAYPEGLGCGCVCAGHMESDYEGARRREKNLRNASSRRQRWLTRDWRTSRNGNPFLNADGYNIVVYSAGVSGGANAHVDGDMSVPESS